jgi:hypothetical protein
MHLPGRFFRESSRKRRQDQDKQQKSPFQAKELVSTLQGLGSRQAQARWVPISDEPMGTSTSTLPTEEDIPSILLKEQFSTS